VEFTPVTEVKSLRPILITLTPSKPVPVNVTNVPTGPDEGDMPVMIGPTVALALHALVVAIAI
jgi:hypothetical protein